MTKNLIILLENIFTRLEIVEPLNIMEEEARKTNTLVGNLTNWIEARKCTCQRWKINLGNLTNQGATNVDLSIPTPLVQPPAINEESHLAATTEPNEKASRPATSSGTPTEPIGDHKEGVFHTPIFNDQWVEHQGGADITLDNGEEPIQEEFNCMLDMETLYDGLPYPFCQQEPKPKIMKLLRNKLNPTIPPQRSNLRCLKPRAIQKTPS